MVRAAPMSKITSEAISVSEENDLMRKPTRIAVAALAAAAAAGIPASGAGALDTTLTATVTAGNVGSRTIVANPVTMSSVAGTSTLTGSLATTVTEAARTGTNPWSVTAAIGVLTDTVTPANTLANTNMSISNRAVTQTSGGGTATATSGTEVVSAARTLFTTTGQSTAAVYSGTYASTSDWHLALPNGTPTGVYAGTITLTLVQ